MLIDEREPRRRLGRRLHVRLSQATRSELASRASAAGTPVSVAARDLIEDGLKRRATAEADGADQALVALSALVAAEHTLRLLEATVPNGVRLSAQLRVAASAAAESRLEELRAQLEETH
jgi:hypothetical protein